MKLPFFGVLILYLMLGSILPGASGSESEIQHNKKLSSNLTSKIKSQVTVFDTELFHIIVSKRYENKALERIAPNVVDGIKFFNYLLRMGSKKNHLWPVEKKGRLVILEDRQSFNNYIDIFDQEAQPAMLSSTYVERTRNAQSFYWMEPYPYAVCCCDGMTFDEAEQHLFHLLGHILLTWYDYNYKFLPPWLHEGFGAFMAIRYTKGNNLFCTEGLNNAVLGTGVFKDLNEWARSENWPQFFKESHRVRSRTPLEELNRLDLRDFDHKDAAFSWSFTAFLIDQHPKGFKRYVDAMKSIPTPRNKTSDWPAYHHSKEKFQTALKCSFGDMEKEWIEWAKLDRDYKSHNPSGDHSSPNAEIEFDPAKHLKGFTDLEKEEVQEELSPFIKLTGGWITPDKLKQIQSDWARVMEEMLNKEAAHKKMLDTQAPGLEQALARLKGSHEHRFLNLEEMTRLFMEDEPSPELMRPMILYLVQTYGCLGAFSQLNDNHNGHWPAGLEEELNELKQAAEFEKQIIQKMVSAKTSIKLDFWPLKVRVIAERDGRLICTGKKKRDSNFSYSGAPDGCQIIDKGKEVEIRCPLTYISFKAILTLAKNKLKMKTDQDRLGYLKLCLFRAEEKAFQNELRRIKAHDQEKKKLGLLLPDYLKSKNSASLITLLTGNAKDCGDKLDSILAGVKGYQVHQRVKPRMIPILKRILIEQAISKNKFLKTFKGFNGIQEETGVAHFLYDFKDKNTLEDLTSFPQKLKGRLNARYKADSSISESAFQVKDEKLTCYGNGAFTLAPVFTGDTEVIVHVKVTRKEGVPATAFYYLLIGYGLDESEAYVSSTCLTHVEIQSRIYGRFKLHEVSDGQRSAGNTEGCIIRLKGTADQISHSFNNEKEWVVPEKGQRTGRVFVWVYGPREFEIKRIEVKAAIDTDWLLSAAENSIAAKLDGVN